MNIQRYMWILLTPLVFALSLVACGSEFNRILTEQIPEWTEIPTSGEPDIIISPPADQQPDGDDIIINVFPEEYLIYQGYLEAINARPTMADYGVIEGTVVSLTLGEVCPYQDEECPIEPYPNDWGKVRVDRVLSNSNLSGGDTDPILEQPAQNDSGEETSITGSQGQDLDSKVTNLIALSEGQEVTTQFILTARPVIVRYVPGDDMNTTDSSSKTEGGQEDTVEQPVQPGEYVFMQLIQEDGVYIFTTKVGEVSEETQNKLQGLEVGTRFRAGILYDGILYINEYEIIP